MTHITCRLTACRTGISSGTLRYVIEYGLGLTFFYRTKLKKVEKRKTKKRKKRICSEVSVDSPGNRWSQSISSASRAPISLELWLLLFIVFLQLT